MVDAVVGHAGLTGLEVRIAVGSHVADPEIVGPDLGAGGGVDPLAEDLLLALHERADIVVAFPHDQVLVVDAVVRHRG